MGNRHRNKKMWRIGPGAGSGSLAGLALIAAGCVCLGAVPAEAVHSPVVARVSAAQTDTMPKPKFEWNRRKRHRKRNKKWRGSWTFGYITCRCDAQAARSSIPHPSTGARLSVGTSAGRTPDPDYIRNRLFITGIFPKRGRGGGIEFDTDLFPNRTRVKQALPQTDWVTHATTPRGRDGIPIVMVWARRKHDAEAKWDTTVKAYRKQGFEVHLIRP